MHPSHWEVRNADLDTLSPRLLGKARFDNSVTSMPSRGCRITFVDPGVEKVLLAGGKRARISPDIDPSSRGQPVDDSTRLQVDISRVLVSGVRVGALFQFLGDAEWREDENSPVRC